MGLIRAQNVEATAGFEPANEGFADPRPYSQTMPNEHEPLRTETAETGPGSGANGSAPSRGYTLEEK
jgi:hypothetical protein